MRDDTGNKAPDPERPRTPLDPPLPPPANDDGPLDSAYYERLRGVYAHKHLDFIEARVAKLERRPHLRLVSGGNVESEIAYLRNLLAVMDVSVATLLGIPTDNLPADLGGLR